MAVMEEPVNLLEKLRPKLILEFKFNLRNLANLMHPEGFLSGSDYETVTAVASVHNDSVKAEIMVESLISKVKINSKNYQIFLKLVQPQPRKFHDMLDLLHSGESNILF